MLEIAEQALKDDSRMSEDNLSEIMSALDNSIKKDSANPNYDEFEL